MKNKRILGILLIIITTMFFCGQVKGAAISPLKVISSRPDTVNKIIGESEDILIIFNQRIQQGIKFKDIVLRDINNISVPVLCKINGSNLTIDPINNLNPGGYYTATIPYDGVKGENGDNLQDNFTLVIVVAGDFTNPTIVGKKPDNGNKDVDINSIMTIKFSEKIRAEANISNVEILYGNNNRVPIYIGINGDTLTIKPLRALDYNTSYFLVIPQNAIGDFSGNSYFDSELIYFTTKTQGKALTVSSSRPSNSAKYFQINEPIQVSYNENIIADSGIDSIVVKDREGNIPVGCSINNNILYIFPKNGLNFAYNTTYSVSIPGNAIKGVSGASSKTAYNFDFTTDIQSNDPKLIDANPQNGINDFKINGKIKLTFSENIWASESIKKIVLRDERGKIIPYDLSISNDIVTIEPLILLEYNTTYIYNVPYGAVFNSASIPLKQEYEFKFKTSIEKFPPRIDKTYPQNNATNTTVDGGVTIIFNEEVKKGDNFDYITLRDKNYNEIPVVRELNDRTLKLKPVNNLNLDYNTKFLVTIPYGAVKDVWDNPFEATTSFNFTTGFERFSPIVKTSNPTKGAKDISIKPQLEVVFNDNIIKGDNFGKVSLIDDEGTAIKYEIAIEADKLIIKPFGNLLHNNNYSLVVPIGAVTDKWGGTTKEDYLVNFTTSRENVAPVLKLVTPVNGNSGVDINTIFTVTFSENIVKSKTFNKLSLQNGSQRTIPITTEISGNKLLIKPVKPLEEGNNYTLRIPQDALTDKSLNQLKTDIVINVSTKTSAANKDTLAVSLVKYNPATNEIGISFNKNITYSKGIKKLLIKDGSGKLIPFTLTLKTNMLILKPKTALVLGTRYILTVPNTAVQDQQMKNLVYQYSYSFIR